MSSNLNIRGLRMQFPTLQQPAYGRPLHYLDNAATTPMPQPVLDALQDFEIHSRANIERGTHYLANRATDAYELAREQVARYLNAANMEEVIFTSGTTASINLLAYSLTSLLQAGDEVLVSVAEHHSNLVPWQMLRQRSGITLKAIPITSEGRLDLDKLDELVTERCRLIAVHHTSNVTGAITDVQRIVSAAGKVGAQVLLDGAQAVPHGPVDVQALGVDYYAFSGHKCFGPTGVGVLWGRQSLLQQLPPFMGGGGMVEQVTLEKTTYTDSYRRFEAGTPAIAQAVGLGVALNWLQQQPWDELHSLQQQLSQKLLNGLHTVPGLRLLGPGSLENRMPIFSFDIDGIHSHDICHVLDQQGVALRGGHHCAQPLMAAFNVIASSRASISLFNNDDDIDALLQGLILVREMLL